MSIGSLQVQNPLSGSSYVGEADGCSSINQNLRIQLKPHADDECFAYTHLPVHRQSAPIVALLWISAVQWMQCLPM